MWNKIQQARAHVVHGRYVYYGSEEGYYMQHPAQDMTFGNASDVENCGKFDPRYRYVLLVP